VNVIIEGDCVLGDGVVIGAHSILRNCRIGAGTKIRPFSYLDESTVGENASVGPYARLRTGTELGDDVHVGNFVETKNTRIGAGSKAGHLTYLGDAVIGRDCNIGAGTITCNYDGANKHQTTIDDRVFVGSNSSLVAPVHLHDGVTTGAGSVITKPVPAGELAVGRARQLNLGHYTRPVKTNKK
jgi:bifunctional UDP-N-acetylglucosamine pyrophosphorylase/glucosamine-1-phosphate N-acetyltransferase